MGDREAATVGETRTGQTGIGALQHRFPASSESDARTSGVGEAESQRTSRDRKTRREWQPRTCQGPQNRACLLREKRSRLTGETVKVPKEKLIAAEPTSLPILPHRSGSIGRMYACGRLVLTDLNRALALLLLTAAGCSYNKPLGRVPHLNGSGYTEYRYISAGGIIRPGLGVIVAQTFGTNPPPAVLIQGQGPPMAPNLLGNATGAATGLLAGYALGRGSDGDTTTIIQGDPPAPMMDPPKAPPKPPVHPPNGRPPGNRPPNNRPKH